MKEKSLTIKDYKKIRTPFVFFDETGSVNDINNRFFGLGMVKCMQPYFLDTKIRKIRERNHFYDEIKSNKIGRRNLKVMKEILDAVFDTPGIRFGCIVIDKEDTDFEQGFKRNPYLAYEKFTEELLKKNIRRNEILIVLADYICTPDKVKFEINVKHQLNEYFDRLAICGVHRVESSGVNLIQVADLLLGAVVYEFKYENKVVLGDNHKVEIYKYIQRKTGLKTFVNGNRQKNFNIVLYNKK